MGKIPLHNQYLLVVAGDHEIINQAVENFRKLFTDDSLANSPKEIAALRQILAVKVPHHFTYEEELVFPTIVAEQPELATQIASLRKDHAKILKETARLEKLLTGSSCTAEVWSALLDMFAALQKHTDKEDKLFGPAPAKK
jgi:iron-sulfur cluster repair protein YtfE (RIC family)